MDQELQERLLRAEEVLLASWHAGADRGMDAFYSAIDAIGRGVLPISAEERAAFLDRTAPYVATARHVLFDGDRVKSIVVDGLPTSGSRGERLLVTWQSNGELKFEKI